MKQLKFLLLVAIVMLVFFSCNSGSDEKTMDATKTDTAAAAAPDKQPETPARVQMTMLIKHKVANFNKWLPTYEGDDSARTSHGLHNYVVGRGVKDSNMVLIALHMDDTAKARKFSMMPGLKATMQKAGVTGAPKIMYSESRWYDSTTNSSATRVIISQKVKDWDAWKKAFDSHKQARTDAGLTDRGINQAIDDPHTVSVILVVNDMKKAEAFVNSKDLKDKMAEAGVEGPPDVFFYRVVKQY